LKIRVIKVGRVAYPELRALAAMYAERLAPYARVESLEVKDEAALDRLLGKPSPDHQLIALDERGREWTSRQFASSLQSFTDDPGVKSLTFLIGGPMGLSPSWKTGAHALLSLSKATFTSDIAWLLIWEQLYRAFNILKGTGYHHD